ncbi:PLD nuclease N-terminal domain-containing protein [Leucobacter manosquensis]|uniref:PLDc_N domain-containing protein n=1 Tax=Leucobacter manosquensis TaxID=2810611 RepID=A0ABS5M411_9MICO|nr:PLD nuclease N-terminal domain-containing protein [Leucobacter manosquensis]MBS3181926.1 PLDc_N domain-containing protein [Leucobacter manosquensis]
MNLDFPSLATTTGLVIVIALSLQALLAAVGLLVLVNTPTERVQFGRKWPWVLIILLVNTIGTILFLAVGRRPAPASDTAAQAPANVASTVQGLYGSEPGAQTGAQR